MPQAPVIGRKGIRSLIFGLQLHKSAPAASLDSLEKLKSALAGHYVIERTLGFGGMATVYVAEDLKHHRQVAIKVMRPELAEGLGAERFLREVEIAAKLSHPNILPVYDSGNANGILYYVMPLVEGESLPDRLARERQLPVGEALRIAREVAEALAYAHAHGIVHRDIKPANILMHSGHAMVADFGIARATSNVGTALTQTGLAVGTPHYMSPEQSSGDHNIDGRTDIYALGCVLYEMLAGEPPFTGPTPQAIIARSITDTARPLQQTRPTLAPVVSTAVFTALAKAPADRFANATDMAKALVDAEDQVRFGSGATAITAAASRSRLPVAVVAFVVVVLGLAGWRFLAGRASASPVHSVAVLPFVNQGPAEQSYVADGIVDELRDRLSKLDKLTVTASASADQYKQTTKTSAVIAKELGVDQLLMGKVSWRQGQDGKRQLHVVTELVNGSNGAVTWRDSFDADSSQVFAIQDRIATSVAAALGTKVTADDAKSLAGRPTQNAEAYDFYLQGRAISGVSASAARAAANYFEQAVALDSNFARAWGGLSINLSLLYAGARDSVVGHRAKEALDRLLRLANDSAGAHDVAAVYYANVTIDDAASRRETARALALDSNDVSALMNSASSDLTDGRYQATFDKLSRARKINPRATGPLTNLLRAQIFLGRYAEAVASSQALQALKPKGYDTMEWVVLAYLAQGDSASARRVTQELLQSASVTELVAYFAGYQELSFVLGDNERQLLFRMTPAAFDNDRAWWGQVMATAYREQGDVARSRAYADSSLAFSKLQSDAAPKDQQLRALYAVVLAYAGNAADATREVERAVSEAKASKSTNLPYYMMQQIRVELANGQNDKAMDTAEELLKQPSYITRGYMRVDPTLKPLRGNPRFEKMLVPPISGPTG